MFFFTSPGLISSLLCALRSNIACSETSDWYYCLVRKVMCPLRGAETEPCTFMHMLLIYISVYNTRKTYVQSASTS